MRTAKVYLTLCIQACIIVGLLLFIHIFALTATFILFPGNENVEDLFDVIKTRAIWAFILPTIFLTIVFSIDHLVRTRKIKIK